MSNSTTNNRSINKKSKLPNFIGPTDPKIDNEAREKLISARIGLLLKHSFFGNISTRMVLTNADDWCSTAATDGLRFYYNSKFISFLKPKEVVFLVAHEVLHAVYDHMGRRNDRNPKIWNIAADYAVNADLKKHQIGQFITSIDILYDAKYQDMPTEEIYEHLVDNMPSYTLDELLDKMLDEHLDSAGDEDEDEEDGEKSNKRPKLSKKEREEARKELRDAILNAARAADPGSLPKGVERLVSEITNPVMPWRELIQTNIISAIRTDFSWMKPSRKNWHIDAILPGMTPGLEIDVTVFVDLSGSISEKQAKDFLAEVVGMVKAFEGFKLHIACFDTRVYNPKDYSSENMDSVEEYELKGGGGTDFTCIFEYLQDEGRVPNRLIVFTDGMPYGSWGTQDYCDTTWIIHGSNNIIPPWGTWAYYDDHKIKHG